jgi:hypothetical protein
MDEDDELFIQLDEVLLLAEMIAGDASLEILGLVLLICVFNRTNIKKKKMLMRRRANQARLLPRKVGKAAVRQPAEISSKTKRRISQRTLREESLADQTKEERRRTIGSLAGRS